MSPGIFLTQYNLRQENRIIRQPEAKEVLPVRKLLAIVSLGLLVLLAVSGLGHARTSARTHFVITGGTVTIAVSSDLLGVFAADNATLSTGGGATTAVTKTKQTILTLPVLGGLPNNAVIELAKHCRCVGFTTRGTLIVTGNGKKMTLAKPQLNIDGLTRQAQLSFFTRGSRQAAITFPPINLPRSISGTTFSLSGLVGPVSYRNVFQGSQQHLGDPGDGAVPNFPADRTVTFGTFSMKLKLKPLS